MFTRTWQVVTGIAFIMLTGCGAVRTPVPVSNTPSLASLLQAATNDDVAVAQRSLDAGIDPNGNLPLMRALAWPPNLDHTTLNGSTR